jgi:hypothetical protein
MTRRVNRSRHFPGRCARRAKQLIEAICYGAVARVTQLGPLFRAIALKPTEEVAEVVKERWKSERIKPYDTPAWQNGST